MNRKHDTRQYLICLFISVYYHVFVLIGVTLQCTCVVHKKSFFIPQRFSAYSSVSPVCVLTSLYKCSVLIVSLTPAVPTVYQTLRSACVCYRRAYYQSYWNLVVCPCCPCQFAALPTPEGTATRKITMPGTSFSRPEMAATAFTSSPRDRCDRYARKHRHHRTP